MSEIVNLRRARKEKARKAEKTAAESARAKHGVPKRVRDLEEARHGKLLHDIDARRLEDKE